MSRPPKSRSLAAGVLTCAVALTTAGTTAVAADPGADRSPAARAEADRRPLHTSDGQRGWLTSDLPVVPRLLRRAEPAPPVRTVVAPGVTLTRWEQVDARGPQRFHLLTVDPSVPGVGLDYAGPGRIARTATVPALVAGADTVGGVNGDFFDIGDTDAPLGVGQAAGRGLLHARTHGWNASFVVRRGGRPDIVEVPMRTSVRQRPELKVTNLNSPFVRPGGIGVYTADWGRTSGYRVTSGQRRNVRMLVVRGGRVVEKRAKLTKGRAIKGTLLIGRGKGARALAAIPRGSRLGVTRWLEGGPRMAISGNRILVDEGVVKVVDDRELHPRTALGIDRDTGEVLLLVVDGRQAASRGATMVELAETMADLGADEALNLDGGGSSTMVARSSAGSLGVVNAPSDGSLRKVANALRVTYRPPAG
ncbi:phosphodiester glycosidase family protein [Nocardioides sp. SYSU DS0663]|uniref:phosphodiester glycosidase family protein n=1 Tax=Nocardioides sp. SYSU DS0663 TaxID=3416445 RepID=UPI003F4B6754